MIGGLMVVLAGIGQYGCGTYGGYGTYGQTYYTPVHSYYQSYQSYVPHTGKGFVEGVKVYTKDHYGGYDQDLIAALAGTRLKQQYDDASEKERLAKVVAEAVAAELAKRPAPAPEPQEIQVFQAPQTPQYAPRQPSYGPAPSEQQPTPQQPSYAPQAPGKSPAPAYGPGPGKSLPYNPAGLPPQVPQPNPAAGDWTDPSMGGGAGAAGQDAQAVLSSILGNNCLTCHDDASKQGGYSLDDGAGGVRRLALDDLKAIYKRAVLVGDMPKRSTLPPRERAALDDAIMQQFAQARR